MPYASFIDEPPAGQSDSSRTGRFVFVAPRHREGGDWPWLTQIGPMKNLRIQPIYRENTCERFPKATTLYFWWQHWSAIRAVRHADLAFLFSTDVAMALTSWPAQLLRHPARIYVGFTQDGEWPARYVERIGRALRRCDAVTVFSEDERQLYIQRYGVEPRRMHVMPIHTDETNGYRQYSEPSPVDGPYVLSMGSPNRRFMPVARACAALKIPLVIITRPTHENDSLEELAKLRARIILNADKHKALVYLKHARLASMVFQTPHLPGAFTTLIHAMYLRSPAVVSSCLGISDYVVDGETGFITPHDDDEALQHAIGRVWEDTALRERFVEHGYERAVRLFSLEAAAERFSELAERVWRSARTPARRTARPAAESVPGSPSAALHQG